MSSPPDIIVLVGPTASGKSATAQAWARKAGGEIVNADSRQIYRGLDAGTAKPSREELSSLPHHLYDFLDPKEAYSAGQYARDAQRVLEDIAARRRRPILVGGTGLYLRSLFEGLAPLPHKDETVRGELREIAVRRGKAYLHQQLRDIDPVAADRIPYQNIQRVIRALEVHRLTGRPISELQAEPGRPATDLAAAFFGLRWEKDALRERIRRRTEAILPGLIEETRALLAQGARGDEPGLQGIGYREALNFHRCRLSREELFNQVLKGTLAYAKRQLTWFNRDPSIAWLSAAEPFDPEALAGQILDLVH